MKGIYLISIAFMASWTVIIAEKSVLEKEDECPTVDTCPPKLLFHETDCALYYECNRGQKVLRFCAPGRHFSKKWNGCVMPSKSECQDNEGENRDCRKNGDLVAHECDCYKFYECKNNRKVLHECPNGEHFDKKSGYCVRGSCGDKPVSPECSEGKNIPHECQCEKYYLCKNNRKVLQECEEGSHFNNKTLTCKSGPCDSGEDRCEENAKISHECDCNLYYTCTGREWILSHCKSGLHFSSKYKICMEPIDADCDPDVEKPGDCSNPSNEKFPHECDCRLYYRCINKKKQIYGCSWGENFDKDAQVCADRKEVNCKNE